MRKRRSPIGCLFWIALILLIVVIFVFNRGRFETALKSTGLENLVTKSLPKQPSATGAPSKPGSGGSPLAVRSSGQAGSGSGQTVTAPQGGGQSSGREGQGAGGASGSSGHAATTGGSGGSASGGGAGALRSSGSAASGSAAPEVRRYRQSLLYYIRVSSDGTPQLRSITRDVPNDDSPLTDTMRSLLGSLSEAETRAGLVSLIPTGTELLGVTIRDGTAYIDFNDRFRFNSLGAEGFRAELQQVVFTATQFPTVERVQILIGGRVRHYLGPEGMAIDKPLTRATFSEG